MPSPLRETVLWGSKDRKLTIALFDFKFVINQGS